jgi:glycosyltransferase involved in cell wall biosynthesis
VRVLIVVPALNEERALPPLLEELRRGFPQPGIETSVLVVDDGSSDGTAEVARAAGVRVARLSRNLGIGGAVQCGLRVGFREGFDCAVQIDGDGQHPPAELPKLLTAFGDPSSPDLVVGSRFLENGGFRSTWLRRIGVIWLRLVLWFLGIRVTDPTSGFRLYGRRALAIFNRTYPYDYPEPEALAIAKAARLRILEVPVDMRPRQGGRSSIAGLQTMYYMIKVTLAVVLSFVRSRWMFPNVEKETGGTV